MGGIFGGLAGILAAIGGLVIALLIGSERANAKDKATLLVWGGVFTGVGLSLIPPIAFVLSLVNSDWAVAGVTFVLLCLLFIPVGALAGFLTAYVLDWMDRSL